MERVRCFSTHVIYAISAHHLISRSAPQSAKLWKRSVWIKRIPLRRFDARAVAKILISYQAIFETGSFSVFNLMLELFFLILLTSFTLFCIIKIFQAWYQYIIPTQRIFSKSYKAARTPPWCKYATGDTGRPMGKVPMSDKLSVNNDSITWWYYNDYTTMVMLKLFFWRSNCDGFV